MLKKVITLNLFIFFKYFSNPELCHENDCSLDNPDIPGFYFIFLSVQACILTYHIWKFYDVFLPPFYYQAP